MDKAEEAALAAYPDYEKENSVGVLYKVSRKAERTAYAEGYRNACGKIVAEVERRMKENEAVGFFDLANELAPLVPFIESLEKEQPKKINVTGDDFSWIDELKHDLEHQEELDERVAEALKKKQPEGLDSEDDNLTRFAMYWYGDDKRRVYLSNVFVGEGMRHKGEGNFILNAAEAIAKMAFADEILLKVKKGSFSHEWYKRHGYVDDEPDEEDKTMIWMKKEV